MEFDNLIEEIGLPQNITDILRQYSLEKSVSEYSEQMLLYSAAIKELKTTLEVLDNEFHLRNDYNPIHHIETRLKSPHSIFDKLRRRGLPVSVPSIRENLTDIAGIRVICNYIDDAYRISELLLGQNDISLIEKKDYIANPKKSGYRSLHIIVSVSVYLSTGTVEVPAEIQIRTIAMDYWASLEHRLKYKNEGTVPEEYQKKMRMYADELADMEQKMQEIHRRIQE